MIVFYNGWSITVIQTSKTVVGLSYSDHNGSKKELNSLSSAISGPIVASLIEEGWLERPEIQAFSGWTGFNQYRSCLNPHLDSCCHSKLVLEVAFHGMIGKVVRWDLKLISHVFPKQHCWTENSSTQSIWIGLWNDPIE